MNYELFVFWPLDSFGDICYLDFQKTLYLFVTLRKRNESPGRRRNITVTSVYPNPSNNYLIIEL